jgi:hypothetical protein
MSVFFRILIAIILVVGLNAVRVSAQAPVKVVKKASVAGKVTIKGKAAAGVTIAVRTSDFSNGFEPTYKAVTDLQGLYRVNDIPPGNYQISTVAAAYVTVNEPTRKIVVLNEGEAVEGIDFSLVRGGVITGKVTDADGHPVIELRVNLVRADLPPEQRNRSSMASSMATDDRGIYRMFGIPAGRYKVAVGQGPDSFFNSVAAGRAVYKETFHPDVNDYDKAKVLEVTEGSESSNVDISLGRATQTFTASGRVVNGENGEPVGNLRFGLRLITENRGGGAFVSSQALSNSQGQFVAENLIPSKYAIFILPQMNSPLRGDAVTFEIVDQDVKDLVVTTSKGVTLSGVVVVENTEDRAVLARLGQFQVQGFVQSQTPGGNIGHNATINGDGTFQMTGLESGAAYLSLGPFNDSNLKSFNLVRTEKDGIPQTRGIEIKNTDISGVRLIVSYGSGTLRGQVNVINGTIPANGRILLRLTKPGETNSRLRPPTVDSRGHFIVEGLPVGVYDVVASIFVPGVRTEAALTKQQVTITDENTTDLILNLDLGQKPNP